MRVRRSSVRVRRSSVGIASACGKAGPVKPKFDSRLGTQGGFFYGADQR
jgi:hypothetical protein